MSSNKRDRAQQKESAPEAPIAAPKKPERSTKQALLLALIGREGGATLEELTSATGWLPHTVRAAMTGLRKRSHDIRRVRIEGVSRYFIGSAGE
jgi:hypothetical protein